MLWWMRNCENLDKAVYEGVGRYNIPEIAPVMLDSAEFIAFSQAKRCENPGDKAIHFFLSDYQFFRVWTGVELYMPMLEKFKCVCTPDFSLYTDFPFPVQLYNHYRKHWLGRYWQEHGITVIPSISWSDESSYDWCFDGEPVGGAVAISSVGTQMDAESKRLFRQGYEEMMARLKPATIFFHGSVPEWCEGNIVPIPAHQQRLRKLR